MTKNSKTNLAVDEGAEQGQDIGVRLLPHGLGFAHDLLL
jgi:hypothetical protein